jgi:hypothetical protein
MERRGGDLKTSYFAKYRGENGISIARKSPNGFAGQKFPALFPSWELINMAKEGKLEEYQKAYLKKLSYLDVAKVYETLFALTDGEPVLLCWEKPGKFCHRRIVAEWFEKELGIKVKEMEYDKP